MPEFEGTILSWITEADGRINWTSIFTYTVDYIDYFLFQTIDTFIETRSKMCLRFMIE